MAASQALKAVHTLVVAVDSVLPGAGRQMASGIPGVLREIHSDHGPTDSSSARSAHILLNEFSTKASSRALLHDALS